MCCHEGTACLLGQRETSGCSLAPGGCSQLRAAGARTRSGMLAMVANRGLSGRAARRVLLIALAIPVIGLWAAIRRA